MNFHSIRIWRVLVWSVLFTCLGLLGLNQALQTDWYKNHLCRRLLAGDSDERWAAAAGLARLGAEACLLEGLKSDQADVREASRRGLEHLWFVAAGRKAYRMTDRAIQAMEREEYPAALDLLNELVERYPRYAEGWNRRASLYWQIGEYDKSILDCQRALALNPNHYGAWQGIGVCQLQLGDIAAACQSLRTVLRIVPHDEATRQSLARCEELLRVYPSPLPEANYSILL